MSSNVDTRLTLFEGEHVQAVLALLKLPDCQLHFPEFANVPFFGTKSDFNKAKGRSEWGGPAYMLETPSRLTLEALSDRPWLTTHDADDDARREREDRKHLKRLQHLPRDLRRLYRMATLQNVPPATRVLRSAGSVGNGQASVSTSVHGHTTKESPDLDLQSRLSVVGVGAKVIVDAIDDCVLAPLQYAITHLKAQSPPQEAALASKFYERRDDPGGWSDAVLSILRHTSLNAKSGKLEWRPDYFRFSLTVLILERCELAPDSLIPLGAFIEKNKNLVELRLAGNEHLVSLSSTF